MYEREKAQYYHDKINMISPIMIVNHQVYSEW